MPQNIGPVGDHLLHQHMGIGLDIALEHGDVGAQGQGFLIAGDQAFAYLPAFAGLFGL